MDEGGRMKREGPKAPGVPEGPKAPEASEEPEERNIPLKIPLDFIEITGVSVDMLLGLCYNAEIEHIFYY